MSTLVFLYLIFLGLAQTKMAARARTLRCLPGVPACLCVGGERSPEASETVRLLFVRHRAAGMFEKMLGLLKYLVAGRKLCQVLWAAHC